MALGMMTAQAKVEETYRSLNAIAASDGRSYGPRDPIFCDHCWTRASKQAMTVHYEDDHGYRGTRARGR